MFFKPIYILILGATIVIDYFVGLNLIKLTGSRKKWLLILSIVANVGVLAVFKYYNFFASNINYALQVGSSSLRLTYLDILLPIGLSFHTFQAMSYTVEVYRGKQTPEKHFGIYALYVMFYPQLVAGPIERPQHILHQFYEKKTFNANNVSLGLKLMLWGFFKKVFVADTLSVYVRTVYLFYLNETGSTLLLGSFFFAIQIYCDFSGYSDIARGIAKTMGYDLMINFKRPYLASSISDFWRRWHISLSSWFKDYVYFPLGGNKTSLIKWCRNMLIVFLLSGIWHGANWTFVVWGALHGIFTVLHKLLEKIEEKTKAPFLKKIFKVLGFTPLAILINFAFVTFAWIFFRAENMHQAFGIIKQIFTQINKPVFTKSKIWFRTVMTGVFIVLGVDIVEELKLNINMLHHKSIVVRMGTIILLIMAIVLFGSFNHQSFIYFQF